MYKNKVINCYCVFSSALTRNGGFASTFGSKAKFAKEKTPENSQSIAKDQDILDIGSLDADVYLSDFDGPIKSSRVKSVLKSVIVRPADLIQNPPVRIADSVEHRLNHRISGKSSRKIILSHKKNQIRKPRFASHSPQLKKSHSETPLSEASTSYERRETVVHSHRHNFSSSAVRTSFETHVPTPLVQHSTAIRFESRSTQTDKTGPCKCSRDIAKRNKKRRKISKQNQELVCELAKRYHEDK